MTEERKYGFGPEAPDSRVSRQRRSFAVRAWFCRR
jgi:hypothetical protein